MSMYQKHPGTISFIIRWIMVVSILGLSLETCHEFAINIVVMFHYIPMISLLYHCIYHSNILPFCQTSGNIRTIRWKTCLLIHINRFDQRNYILHNLPYFSNTIIEFKKYAIDLQIHIHIYIHTYGGVPSMGVPQNRWFIKENPIKMNDMGRPPFQETCI